MKNKYAECRAGLLNLYEGYTVKQVNIVFDFIGGYSKNLFKNLSEAIPKDTMKIKKLIEYAKDSAFWKLQYCEKI